MWPATPASNTKGMVSKPKSVGYFQGVHELKSFKPKSVGVYFSKTGSPAITGSSGAYTTALHPYL